MLYSQVTTDDATLRLEGYLSKNALRDGFNNTVEISETKNDSITSTKFFQTVRKIIKQFKILNVMRKKKKKKLRNQ